MENIQEDYQNWKVNSFLLYRLLISHTSEWPSLFVEWIPGLKTVSKDLVTQKLITGTHTTPGEPNYLFVSQVELPKKPIENQAQKRFEPRSDYEGFEYGNPKQNKFLVLHQIPHPGEVNRARYMPQKWNLIATKTVQGDVLLFNCLKYSIKNENVSEVTQNNASASPLSTLKGHTKEGFGLSWHPQQTGILASCSDDGRVCVWDINAKSTSGSISPVFKTEPNEHVQPLGDIAWVHGEESTVVCCCDDGSIVLWDLREGSNTTPSARVQIGNLPINCVASSLHKNRLFATGGADQIIKLWDMRKVDDQPVHSMTAHKDIISSLEFSGNNQNLLGSASKDRFVNLWDMSRIGMEQTPEDAEDGPPELIFSHGGHRSPISDISWNPEKEYDMMVASVSEDNIGQIWQPSAELFQDDSDSDGDIEQDLDQEYGDVE